MNINKFTEKAQEAVVSAQNVAGELNHAEVVPEHLLTALVEQSGGIVPSSLRKLALDPTRVASDARALLKSLPQAYGAELRMSPRMKLVFDSAQAEAQRLQDEVLRLHDRQRAHRLVTVLQSRVALGALCACGTLHHAAALALLFLGDAAQLRERVARKHRASGENGGNPPRVNGSHRHAASPG